jgi:hypothetical protein
MPEVDILICRDRYREDMSLISRAVRPTGEIVRDLNSTARALGGRPLQAAWSLLSTVGPRER